MNKQIEKTVLRRIVIQYHKDGLSIRNIAEKIKTSRPGPSERTLRRLGRQIEITLATASKELASHMDVSANTVRKYIPMLEYGARIICHCYLKKQKQTPAMGK
ncbi:hypothetical protein DERF_015064 [Dermatophagoides farinae]|uniref:Uncharacterized protein n=1 Tax=Dermatophagoides farinae TaxID=6954 RepID=A0A922HKT5_DERFA|nr:hypothetical protein DERF_015064 [Dermatophagoides farinae]